jgi:hypothetical protein
MSMTFTGNNIKRYQALVISKALEFYADTGKRVNRAYSPMAMMRMARNITGNHHLLERDYRGAARALREWAEKS